VDLGELDSVGGYGFGLLIQLHKRLEQSGGRLVLRNPTSVVSDMIRVAKLDRFFTIVNDPEGGSCIVVPAERRNGKPFAPPDGPSSAPGRASRGSATPPGGPR